MLDRLKGLEWCISVCVCVHVCACVFVHMCVCVHMFKASYSMYTLALLDCRYTLALFEVHVV